MQNSQNFHYSILFSLWHLHFWK